MGVIYYHDYKTNIRISQIGQCRDVLQSQFMLFLWKPDADLISVSGGQTNIMAAKAAELQSVLKFPILS
jgi:hypothetical protein